VLAVLHPRENLALHGAVALECSGDNDPWAMREALPQLPEELLGRALVAPGLHQDIEGVSVLVHGPPELGPLLVQRDEHLLEVPVVA
jgi:hypothetical protein